MIYNASAWKKETDEKVRSFLKFVSRNKPSDDFTDGLLKSIAEVKRNEIFRKEYMSMGVWETDIREQGMQEGLRKGEQKKAVDTARKFLKMNVLTPAQISEGTGLPIDEVNKLYMELKEEIMAEA